MSASLSFQGLVTTSQIFLEAVHLVRLPQTRRLAMLPGLHLTASSTSQWVISSSERLLLWLRLQAMLQVHTWIDWEKCLLGDRDLVLRLPCKKVSRECVIDININNYKLFIQILVSAYCTVVFLIDLSKASINILCFYAFATITILIINANICPPSFRSAFINGIDRASTLALPSIEYVTKLISSVGNMFLPNFTRLWPFSYDCWIAADIWYTKSLPSANDASAYARYLTISKWSRSSVDINSQSDYYIASALLLRHARSIDSYCFDLCFYSSVCSTTKSYVLASNSF